MRILLSGGTGLVGRAVARRLVVHNDVALVSIVRQPKSPFDQKIDCEELLANPGVTFERIESGQVDSGISGLGTTLRQAGSPLNNARQFGMRSISIRLVSARKAERLR
ncbi:Rossmann-fold NAD(P)-binding domain-containing protein [Paraburkholderia sediminicola]|uniref:hypothetical protein n=1 Tax=Paraburkholderia sediminicola TaxID=458836 RepID=UPI0038BA092C